MCEALVPSPALHKLSVGAHSQAQHTGVQEGGSKAWATGNLVPKKVQIMLLTLTYVPLDTLNLPSHLSP